MSTFKARGIVLKEFYVGESDKIITVFAKEWGRLSLSARGARKPKSKFLASTQPFCYADFVVYEGKGFHALAQAELIEAFYPLRTDLDRLSYAAYLCEIVEKTLLEGEPHDELLLLLLKSMQVLARPGIAADLAARVFEIKLLTLYGFMPNLSSCSCCANEMDDSGSLSTYFFDTLSGGLVCLSCLQKNPGLKPLRIKKPTVAAIAYILESETNKAFHFHADSHTLLAIKKVTAQCLLLFLDIGGTIKINSLLLLED